MECTRGRPPQHDQQKAASRADEIQQAATTSVHRRISQKKRSGQIGKLLLRDGNRSLNRRYRYRDGLAVEVTDGDRPGNQGDVIPAPVFNPAGLADARSHSSHDTPGYPISAWDNGTTFVPTKLYIKTGSLSRNNSINPNNTSALKCYDH